MFGVSRSIVARRWTLPLFFLWGKLLVVAFGFLGFLAHAFDSPPMPPLRGFGLNCDYLLWLEGWGVTLLASAAIASLLRARLERMRGLSPRIRGVFWTCIGGIETAGVAAWAFVVWLYVAPYSFPAR